MTTTVTPNLNFAYKIILKMNIIILLNVITFNMKENSFLINIMYNTQVFTILANSCRV